MSAGTRSDQDWDQFADRSSDVSPATVQLFVFPLTVDKPLRQRGMQLAGYFCPTTEEVAGESQDPAPPKNIPPFLPPCSDFKRDLRVV